MIDELKSKSDDHIEDVLDNLSKKNTSDFVEKNQKYWPLGVQTVAKNRLNPLKQRKCYGDGGDRTRVQAYRHSDVYVHRKTILISPKASPSFRADTLSQSEDLFLVYQTAKLNVTHS